MEFRPPSLALSPSDTAVSPSPPSEGSASDVAGLVKGPIGNGVTAGDGTDSAGLGEMYGGKVDSDAGGVEERKG